MADAARALGLGAGQRLQVKSVVTDTDGTKHVRYERTFNGLEVIGGDLVVERTAAGVDEVGPLERHQGHRGRHLAQAHRRAGPQRGEGRQPGVVGPGRLRR